MFWSMLQPIIAHRQTLYQILLNRYHSVTNQKDRSYPHSRGRYRPLKRYALGFNKDNLKGFWF